MSDIQPGDVVIRVSGEERFMWRGTVIRVDGLCVHADRGLVGLLFEQFPDGPPGYCRCFERSNFRKIEAPKSELSERIRKCRPIPVREDA